MLAFLPYVSQPIKLRRAIAQRLIVGPCIPFSLRFGVALALEMLLFAPLSTVIEQKPMEWHNSIIAYNCPTTFSHTLSSTPAILLLANLGLSCPYPPALCALAKGSSPLQTARPVQVDRYEGV